ncbi:TolC family protein [Brevibacillus panacihumi]|nr:TolC family protein [Brevibacillus panacihumi]
MMNFPYSSKKWQKISMAAVLTTVLGVGSLTAYANTGTDEAKATETSTQAEQSADTAKPANAEEPKAAAKEATAESKATTTAEQTNTTTKPAATVGLENLTLEKAIEQALESNAQLETARLNVKNADLNSMLAYKTPAQMPDDMIGTLDAAKAKYVNNATIEMNRKLNALNLKATESKIKLGAQQAYYDLLYAQDDYNLKKQSLARAEAQLKVAKAAFEVGTKAKTDVLQAEMGLAGAQAALTTAQNNLEIERMDLNDFLGVDLDKKWNIIVSHKQTSPVTQTLQQAEAEALQKRVEMTQVKEELKLAELNVELVEKYSVMATYQGRIARNNVETAKLAIEQKEREISKEVAQAYYNLKAAYQAIEFQKKAQEAAAESYRLTNLRFENGLATTLEVIQAEEELSDRENQYQRAIRTYNLAVVNFQTALGN